MEPAGGCCDVFHSARSDRRMGFVESKGLRAFWPTEAKSVGMRSPKSVRPFALLFRLSIAFAPHLGSALDTGGDGVPGPVEHCRLVPNTK